MAEQDSIVYISVQSLSCVQLFVTPWTAAHQASLSITKSQSLLKLISFESVMPSNHIILCHPFILLPSTFPSTVCACVCVCVCVYCVIFTHSSVSGHLDYFHMVAVLNNAEMNIRWICLFRLLYLCSLDRYTEVQQIITLVFVSYFLTLLGVLVLFSVVAAPIYNPTDSVLEFPFFYTLYNILLILLFLIIAILTDVG